MPKSAEEELWWQAVIRRDPQADGMFFYSVRTTGVFCRPSCPSRQAKRENVDFFESIDAAQERGFRPCKRCHPDEITLEEQRVALIARACRALEEDDTLTLDELARQAFTSRFHFHRIFKEVTGMTPKQYAKARRPEKPGNTVRFGIGESSLGPILVAASDNGICAVFMDDDAEELVQDVQRRFVDVELIGDDPRFDEWMATVVAYVDNTTTEFELPLDIRGTAFQKRVWQALREIPFGTTINYAELAQAIGAPKSARAVANACGANPLAVLIPCHRVVRTNGDLSGYRWGIERKRTLLEREQVARVTR
jgi:AraC family transcriptional regulator of adaptative response/methylated-DNA-[protein]-cysteine methyltransferase